GVAGAKQLAELGTEVGREIAAPGVDVLAEQRDLTHARGGEPLDLGQDLARPAALLTAAHRGDDAVGALRVAPHGDLHPCLVGALAVEREVGCERAVVEPEATACDTDAAGAEPLTEMADRARPERDVDGR